MPENGTKFSSVMRQFHVSKGVLAFLARPTTTDNFFRTFFHPRRKFVERCTLPHSVLSFPTTINCQQRPLHCSNPLLHSPIHLLYVPHNFHRIESGQQCSSSHLRHPTISLQQYAQHNVQHCFTEPATRNGQQTVRPHSDTDGRAVPTDTA